MCCTRPPHVPVATIFKISRYMYRRNALLLRLLKILRQHTTSFALFGAHQIMAVHCSKLSDTGGFLAILPHYLCENKKKLERNTLICKQIWFFERLTWNPAESSVLNVSRQVNVLHKAAPVATIFEISRYMYIRNALLIRLLKILRQPTTGFAFLGTHQVGAVPEFPSTLSSTCSFWKNTH
ncbi:hypothetical protein CSKR_105891 [Clonorchis sinensis]|uniref:Uncharacterized protein n=1 Tax=Clonorchis sinensis TaxID=79923 RepID=A0A3R7G697_CLOSI|nr:hypothetical protein CSKR_105891 [Clonorchis sinensis]